MNGRSERRGNARLRQGIVLAVGLFLLAQVAPGTAKPSTQDRINEAERRLEKLEKQQEVAASRLAQLNADIESLTRQIAQAYAQYLAIQGQTKTTKKTIKQKGKRVRLLQGRLDDRARVAYIQGPGGVVQFVLEADSLNDLSDRVTFLGALNIADSSTAVGIDVERDELKRFQGDLRDLLKEQQQLLDELEAREADLRAKQGEVAAIKAEVDAEAAEVEELIKRLKKKRREELLAQLRAAQQAAGGTNVAPVDASGVLKWCPVDAPRSYIDDFGYPRSGGRTHQGNDVFAAQGTPIRAPFAGVVDESWNSLGGNSVFVRASDGTYVYNAHMSRYAGVDGQHVQPGDLIGYVGNTGNAVGTPYHDHFELHPGGGSAINPYPYLNAVCGVNGGG